MLKQTDIQLPEDHRYMWVTGRPHSGAEVERGIGWYDGTRWCTQSGSQIFDVTSWEELSEEDNCIYGD